jgi:hypothetical protein
MKQFWIGIWALIRSFKSWQGLVSFFLSFAILAGWAYVFLGLGIITGNAWLISVGTTVVTFWWMPVTPGIPFTIGVAILIQRFVFHDKTALTKQQILAKFEKRGERHGLQAEEEKRRKEEIDC